MRLLSKYILAPALISVLAGPALAQVSSPPTASQVSPSSRAGPRYRTPDVARAIDVDRDQVPSLDRMTNRLQTRSLGELGRLNRLDERPRDIRRLEAVSEPRVDWRLGLTTEGRLRLANLTSCYNDEPANIPATGRLRKDDTLGSWRDYIGRNPVRVYNSFNDSLDIPPPGLRGPTPAPGGTSR